MAQSIVHRDPLGLDFNQRYGDSHLCKVETKWKQTSSQNVHSIVMQMESKVILHNPESQTKTM